MGNVLTLHNFSYISEVKVSFLYMFNSTVHPNLILIWTSLFIKGGQGSFPFAFTMATRYRRLTKKVNMGFDTFIVYLYIWSSDVGSDVLVFKVYQHTWQDEKWFLASADTLRLKTLVRHPDRAISCYVRTRWVELSWYWLFMLVRRMSVANLSVCFRKG